MSRHSRSDMLHHMEPGGRRTERSSPNQTRQLPRAVRLEPSQSGQWSRRSPNPLAAVFNCLARSVCW